jgi:Arc/MetJ-type ribon-helix-helix transcriptional regulator
MPKIAAQISKDIYKKIDEEIKLGIFPDISAAINAALRKAYAEKSRAYLRWLMKKEGVTEASMLKEIANLRK